jgi:hypothetical protein
LDIIAELKALLVCLFLLVGWPNVINFLTFSWLDHVCLVIDFFLGLRIVNWSIKLDEDGVSTTNLGFDTGLNDFDSLPVLFVGPSLELSSELRLSQNLDLRHVLVSDHGPLGKPWRLSIVSCSSALSGLDGQRAAQTILFGLVLQLSSLDLLSQGLLHRLKAKIPWMGLGLELSIILVCHN